MKILHILYSGLGGHGNVFFSMVSADREREFEYHALFTGMEDVRSEYIQKCRTLGVEWKFVKKKQGLDTSHFKILTRIIRTSDANILFLHSSAYILPGIMANLFSRKKKKIIIRETQANNLKNKKDWAWLRISFLLADKIVFLSEEFRQEVKHKLSHIYLSKKTAVIPNGINLDTYHPSTFSKNTEHIIGMQSRLTRNKDHITLLNAFALLRKNGLKNIRLKIAGDGECMKELQLLARQLNISDHVAFNGMLDENELANFLRMLDIYVHTSFGETMSTAIMQAMASGLPVIASDVPGIRNMIINGETGILVPVKNEQLLADAIHYLLKNSPFQYELGSNAHTFAIQKFSNETMFKRYKELFGA